MRKLAIGLILYIMLTAAISQGYTENGITVTGAHGNYTTMGMYKGCITCHYVQGTTAVVAHTYTSWVKQTGCQSFNGYTCTSRWYSYTSVDRHKNYTSFFTGFTGGKNPRPGVCLVCHNTASPRFSFSTTAYARTKSRAAAVNSVTHTQGTYYNRRNVVSGNTGSVSFWLGTTVAPLLSYSIGSASPAPVKQWGQTGFVNTVNNCMDCHRPHSSAKAKYLR